MLTAKPNQGTGPTLLEDVLRLQGNFRRVLQPIGVTPLQAGVLCYLHRHAGAQLGDVAASLSVQPPTLVVVVKDLARKRWVTSRRSTGDRRALCLRLSRKGETLVREIGKRIVHCKDECITRP